MLITLDLFKLEFCLFVCVEEGFLYLSVFWVLVYLMSILRYLAFS